jgi:tripartite ATP-independent transporter DctP family solute receptor
MTSLLRRNLLVSATAVMLGAGGLVTKGARAASGKTVLRLGGALADDHPESQAFFWLSQRVKEKTDGRVEIQVFNNGQLGNERDMVEGVQLGTIDIAKCISSVLTGFIPEFMIFDMPYLMKDRAQFRDVLTGPASKEFNDVLLPKAGFKGLAMLDAGVRSVYNSKRPIETPKDMVGLKLRVPESQVIVDTFDALGASPTPMPVGDIYNALQQGVIDGAENAPLFVEKMKHYEVAKYLSETNHFIIPDFLIVSLKAWNKLSPEDQKAIQESAVEMQQWEFDAWDKAEGQAIAELEAHGMKINKVDTTGFRQAVQPVYKKYADKIDPSLLKLIQETN